MSTRYVNLDEYHKKLEGNLLSVTQLYRSGYFKSDEEAMGAFKLAHLQAVDEFGSSWMGMTSDEYDAWMRGGVLPPLLLDDKEDSC